MAVLKRSSFLNICKKGYKKTFSAMRIRYNKLRKLKNKERHGGSVKIYAQICLQTLR